MIDKNAVCHQIDSAIEYLAEVKEAIEQGNLSKAYNSITTLQVQATNLGNRIKDYYNHVQIHGVKNIR